VPESRAIGFIDASPTRVWELAADPARQTEWWPDKVTFEIEGAGEKLSLGSRVRNVEKRPWPMGDLETTLEVERFEPDHQLLIRCMDTGTCSNVVLTEGQGGTFVELTAGNDLENASRTNRLLLTLAGKRLFKRWVDSALDRLRAAAERG
jgi:uncharacterized protein YndB with AHSA1/START domain